MGHSDSDITQKHNDITALFNSRPTSANSGLAHSTKAS